MDGNNPTNIQATAETGGLDDENSREAAGSGVDQKMSVNDAGPLRSPSAFKASSHCDPI